MNTSEPKPRSRQRTPNNRITTDFRISDELWAVLQPLLPVQVNTHRFEGGAHVCPRGEEAKAIKHVAGFKARTWVVERAHSWMNRFRRLLIRWDKKPQNYLAFLHFACGLIAMTGALALGLLFSLPLWLGALAGKRAMVTHARHQ